MQFPFVKLSKYKQLEADHTFACKQLRYYKRKAERLEAANKHPRASDGKFIRVLAMKGTPMGDQIRQYYTGKQIKLSNQAFNFLLRNDQ